MTKLLTTTAMLLALTAAPLAAQAAAEESAVHLIAPKNENETATNQSTIPPAPEVSECLNIFTTDPSPVWFCSNPVMDL
jgi:hypothetical protein